MKKNLILITLLIILLIIIIKIYNYFNYENYYTFFKPFKKENKLILNTDKNNFIYDKIIFITFNEFNDYFQNLILKILKRSNILNIYLYNDYDYKKILENINLNIYKFTLLPNPIVSSYNFQSLKNIRFIGNISQYDIMFTYNMKINNEFKFDTFDDLNKYISKNKIYLYVDAKNTTDNLIVRDLIKKFKYKNNIILINNSEAKNISDLLNNKIIFYIFIDFNSKKINKLLNLDYEDKIRLISMKEFNLIKFNEENNIYFNKIIKFTHNNINDVEKFNYITLSFSNIIITNKFQDDKLIYLITKIIYSNLSNNNNISNINYFNIPIPMLYVHDGSSNFFKDKGLITNSSNNNCKNYVSKFKCPY